jgi:hypothetical protein
MPFYFDKGVFQIKGNVVLDGYWQNENYFAGVREELRGIIRLPDLRLPENSLAIHVRRGDNVVHAVYRKIYGMIPLVYYKNAYKLLIDILSDGISELFVVSNDIDWVEAHLKFKRHVYYVQGDDLKDLELFSSCSHQIISNSTYSWWGAWLNKNPNKIVVSPSQWFRDKRDMGELIPKEWKTI